MIRERERPAFATGNAVDETRVWGTHQLARSSGRARGERRPWLTSDESEPQQMCLNVCFVGLDGFLILRGRIGAGESATSHNAERLRWRTMTHPHPIWPTWAPS